MRTIHRKFPLALIALTAAALLMFGGCESMESRRAANAEPDMNLAASSRSILAGEVVTVTAQTENLLGREADIEWSTTGGSLDEDQNGRIARVKFDRPGTYTVTALLRVGDQVLKSDSVEVEVKAIR